MRGMMDLIKWRAKIQNDHVKSYQDDDGVMSEEGHTRMADDWYAKGQKCVFYDKSKKECSIYPVRPVSCRKVYGAKNCSPEGVSTAAVNEWAEARRLPRITYSPGGPAAQPRPCAKTVIPVGAPFLVQHLVLVEKDLDGKVTTRLMLPVAFVPLTGGH